MTDEQLLSHMDVLSSKERKHQAGWLRALCEIDERRLYSLAGYQNLWEYVTKRLKYSEGSAGKRVQLARTARKFPLVFELIGQSRISMTVVARLSPHLTPENHVSLLTEACGKSVREVEERIAALAPRPDVKDSMRAAGSNPSPQAELSLQPSAAAEPKVVPPPAKPKQKTTPIAEARFHINFTVGKDVADKQRRLQALTRNLSNGPVSMEAVFLAGLEVYLKQYDPELKFKLKRTKRAKPAHEPKPETVVEDPPKPEMAVEQPPKPEMAVEQPSKPETAVEQSPKPSPEPAPKSAQATVTHSRYISRDCKRAVFASGARCSYVSPDGRRCEATTGLQIDHRVPFGMGGSNAIGNLRILCASHNVFVAMQAYGRNFVESRMRPKGS